MTTKSNIGSHTGKYVFVSGINGGREVFFGRPIDEPYGDHITVEGKSISFTPQGFMVVRPFVTLCNFPTKNPNCQVQQITNQEAINEANNLFNLSVTTITRANYPLTYRWVETAIFNFANNTNFNYVGGTNYNRSFFNRNYSAYSNNPFTSFYEGFTNSAEQFRRALFQSPQVTSTRELDKLTELEGDLTIEVGKITNQVAVKFNQLISRNTELTNYFDSIHGFSIPFPTTSTVGGWCYLMNRLQVAKNWARRNGKTPLVREINALTKDGINGLNEIILEHCSTLDTLITETFSQYGINFEIYGDLTPFTNYTAPFSGTVENYDYPTIPTYAGAGV
jgi:hypothetical protein